MSDTTSQPPRANWAISQRGGHSSGLYALAVVDLRAVAGQSTAGLATQLSGGAVGAESNAFAFNVNPRSMDLDEPMAVTVKPTQDGGTFIEHQGQLYKNISITGTTGLRPNRSAEGAIIPLSGIGSPAATFDPDPETGLPRGERTGFDDLIDLRNLFRRYGDLKRDSGAAPYTLMVWQNGKEGEYYVVEPINIKSTRDASSPLTIGYTIALRTIERLDVSQLAVRADDYLKRNGPDGFFQRISDAKRLIAASLITAQSFVDRTATIAQSTITGVLQPVNDVMRALTGIVTSGRRLFDLPQNGLSTVATSATELANALDSLPNNAYVTAGVMTQIALVSRAYRTIARQLRALANESLLFTQQLPTSINQKWAAYANPITGMPRSGGSPLVLGNTSVPNTASVSTIHVAEDIRGAAQRLLGNAALWKVLVVLNQLQPPYISAAGDGINVLRPGDQILFPQAGDVAQRAVSPTAQKFSEVADLEQRLGRDLLLVASGGAGGDPVFDVQVNARGDFSTVDGINNLIQAITVKFSTEQGDLPTHPTFGARLPIGTKARAQSIVSFQLSALATLLSDSRVAGVDQIQTRVVGNTASVRALVSVQGIDDTVNFDFSVRR